MNMLIVIHLSKIAKNTKNIHVISFNFHTPYPDTKDQYRINIYLMRKIIYFYYFIFYLFFFYFNYVYIEKVMNID